VHERKPSDKQCEASGTPLLLSGQLGPSYPNRCSKVSGSTCAQSSGAEVVTPARIRRAHGGGSRQFPLLEAVRTPLRRSEIQALPDRREAASPRTWYPIRSVLLLALSVDEDCHRDDLPHRVVLGAGVTGVIACVGLAGSHAGHCAV
jgi:hypothetical protein